MIREVTFGRGRVLQLGIDIGSAAMEGFAFAVAELPANARVVVTLDGGIEPPPSQFGKLLDWVAYETGVSRPVIVGHSRVPSAVRARDAVSWGACELLGMSKAEIARKLDGRDQTSVGEAVRRAGKLRLKDPAFAMMSMRMAAQFTGTLS